MVCFEFTANSIKNLIVNWIWGIGFQRALIPIILSAFGIAHKDSLKCAKQQGTLKKEMMTWTQGDQRDSGNNYEKKNYIIGICVLQLCIWIVTLKTAPLVLVYEKQLFSLVRFSIHWHTHTQKEVLQRNLVVGLGYEDLCVNFDDVSLLWRELVPFWEMDLCECWGY